MKLLYVRHGICSLLPCSRAVFQTGEKNNGFLVIGQDEFYVKSSMTEGGKIFLSPFPTTLVAHSFHRFLYLQHCGKLTFTSILQCFFFFFLCGI